MGQFWFTNHKTIEGVVGAGLALANPPSLLVISQSCNRTRSLHHSRLVERKTPWKIKKYIYIYIKNEFLIELMKCYIFIDSLPHTNRIGNPISNNSWQYSFPKVINLIWRFIWLTLWLSRLLQLKITWVEVLINIPWQLEKKERKRKEK